MFIHNKSFVRKSCHMIGLNHLALLKKFSKVFLRKCWVVENNDFLENCPVRLNPTRYSSMGHWIALWFHLLVVVAVLHLRVPTQAMHPNISSKRPNLCGNFINIKCGTIHYSISLLWRAGLVMCNSSQPEYQAKHCIAQTRQQMWIQKG